MTLRIEQDLKYKYPNYSIGSLSPPGLNYTFHIVAIISCLPIVFIYDLYKKINNWLKPYSHKQTNNQTHRTQGLTSPKVLKFTIFRLTMFLFVCLFFGEKPMSYLHFKGVMEVQSR